MVRENYGVGIKTSQYMCHLAIKYVCAHYKKDPEGKHEGGTHCDSRLFVSYWVFLCIFQFF